MPIIVVVLGPPVVPIDEKPGGAMSHDGSFDRLVSIQVSFVGWRMHHAYALSKIDVNSVV